MSDQVTSFLRDDAIWKSDRSATEKIILLNLSWRIGQNGCCWPSQERIAKDTSLTRKSVNHSIKSLVASGIIKPDGQTKSGTIKYKINTEALHHQNGHITEQPNEVVTESYTPERTVTESYRGCNRELQVGVTGSYRGCNRELHKPPKNSSLNPSFNPPAQKSPTALGGENLDSKQDAGYLGSEKSEPLDTLIISPEIAHQLCEDPSLDDGIWKHITDPENQRWVRELEERLAGWIEKPIAPLKKVIPLLDDFINNCRAHKLSIDDAEDIIREECSGLRRVNWWFFLNKK